MAVSVIEKPVKESYGTGDYFSPRAWRAMGRIINSGKGIYCWFTLGKPITTSQMTMNIGSVNICGLTNPTITGTISSVDIVGNLITFVLDLSSTHTVGTIALVEFNNTSMTLL